MDTIKTYREAKEFGLDQGLTLEKAVEYAFEVLEKEKENPSFEEVCEDCDNGTDTPCTACLWEESVK